MLSRGVFAAASHLSNVDARHHFPAAIPNANGAKLFNEGEAFGSIEIDNCERGVMRDRVSQFAKWLTGVRLSVFVIAESLAAIPISQYDAWVVLSRMLGVDDGKT